MSWPYPVRSHTQVNWRHGCSFSALKLQFQGLQVHGRLHPLLKKSGEKKHADACDARDLVICNFNLFTSRKLNYLLLNGL